MSIRMRVSKAAKSALGAAAAIGLISGATSPVRADVTIVSQAVRGGTGQTMTLTSYYKGHKIRADSGNNGVVTIFDGDANKLYILNPLQKTYFTLDSNGPAAAMMAMIKVTPTVTVTPTGATRLIAGQTTHEYKFDAKLDMSADTQMMSAMSGGAPAKKGASAAPMHIGTVHIVGDEWVAKIASLPGGGAGTIKASMQQMTTMMPGAKALLEKMGSIPGVPLAEKQTATMNMMVGPGAGKPRVTGSSSTATSVKEGALADSLFAVPAGYKLQENGMMGMPTGGARRPGMPAAGGAAMPPR